MATVTRPPTDLMTAEEFYEFVHRPENENRFLELDCGQVVEVPPPGRTHGRICAYLARILGNYVVRAGRGEVCTNDTGVILGREPDLVRGPDISLFAERTTSANEAYAEETPVLAVEVLSPSDRPSRVARKVSQYLRAGVKLVWVVDPEIREVGVHRPGVELQLLTADDVITGGDELPGFECRVAEFFDLPGETAAT